MHLCLLLVLAVVDVTVITSVNGIAIAEHTENDTASFMKTLESWMDPRWPPCTNFYRFVCGGMIKASPEAFEKPPYTATEADVFKLLVDSLKSDRSNETETNSLIRSAKNLFRACTKVNVTQYKNSSSPPTEEFKRFVLAHSKSISDWPVLKNNSWNETEFNWKRTTIEIDNVSYWTSEFFPANSKISNGIVSVEFKYPEFEREVNSSTAGNKQPVNKTLTDMVNMAVGFGASREYATEELTKVFEFEIALGRIYASVNGSGTKNVTLGKVIEDYPFFSWYAYIDSGFPQNHTLSLDQQLSFEHYYDVIEDINKLIESKPKRVLANFVAWKEIQWFQQVLDYALTEVQLDTSHDDQCLKIVNRQLPQALGTLLARNMLDRDAWKAKVSAVETISANVRQQFVAMLKNATWLDEGTRYVAIKKIESIKMRFGYSDELYNGTLLDEYYRDLGTNEHQFIESIVNTYAFDSKSLIKDAGTQLIVAEYPEWLKNAINATMVNAFYDYSASAIEIPLGLMAGDRFVAVDRPDFMNYGRLAYIIGHEFGHSLDPANRELINGTRRMEWWADFSSAKYDYKVQCLANQYKSFVDLGKELRAKKLPTSDEDVADNLGYRAAYFAYKNLKTEPAEDQHQVLNGKVYNRDQLFWINMASTWCERVKPLRQSLRQFLAQDDYRHSQTELRVVGPFSNMQQFSDDFDCPGDSPMNPPTKCIVL